MTNEAGTDPNMEASVELVLDSTEIALDGRSVRASKKRRDRRVAILRAALVVFSRKGYHQTHVSDIIKAASIARGTFYLYFESKSAIFLELLDQLLQQMRASVSGVDTDEGSPPIALQLVGIVRNILNTVSDNKLLANIIIKQAVGVDAEVDEKLKEFYGRIVAYIQEALEEGQRMGVLRDVDTKVAAMCILGTIKQLMEQIVAEDGNESLEVDRMAMGVLDFNLHGLLPH